MRRYSCFEEEAIADVDGAAVKSSPISRVNKQIFYLVMDIFFKMNL